MAPSSTHCAPPSKRHALCNANGRGGGVSRRRDPRPCFAAQQCPSPAPRRSDLCAYLRPASNNPVTNRRANASFLDMPRAHTRIRISTPHVGVLITFIGACAPPFRHRKRTATNQRLSAVRRCKPPHGPGIAMSGVMSNSARRQTHCLGSKLCQPQQSARRSASRDRPNRTPRQQTNAQNRPLKEGSE